MKKLLLIFIAVICVSCEKIDHTPPGNIKYCMECTYFNKIVADSCDILDTLNNIENHLRDSLGEINCVYRKQQQ